MTLEDERRVMVERQLAARGIHDERVLEAFARLPRELFVAPQHGRYAYADQPVTIGYGQTISQPYMTALMAQTLELRGGERVLDVGAGSGFHAAVLASLADTVVAIEFVPELAELAAKNLAAAGLGDRVMVVTGDGSRGYPPLAPYDAISVAAAAPEIPQSLLDQLADPGILVIPVGSREEQDLRVVTKREGRLQSRIAGYCRFVPLLGAEGWKE